MYASLAVRTRQTTSLGGAAYLIGGWNKQRGDILDGAMVEKNSLVLWGLRTTMSSGLQSGYMCVCLCVWVCVGLNPSCSCVTKYRQIPYNSGRRSEWCTPGFSGSCSVETWDGESQWDPSVKHTTTLYVHGLTALTKSRNKHTYITVLKINVEQWGEYTVHVKLILWDQ